MDAKLIEYRQLESHGVLKIRALLTMPGQWVMGSFKKSDMGYEPIPEGFKVIVKEESDIIVNPDVIQRFIEKYDNVYSAKKEIPFDESKIDLKTLLDRANHLVDTQRRQRDNCMNIGLLVSSGVNAGAKE